MCAAPLGYFIILSSLTIIDFAFSSSPFCMQSFQITIKLEVLNKANKRMRAVRAFTNFIFQLNFNSNYVFHSHHENASVKMYISIEGEHRFRLI